MAPSDCPLASAGGTLKLPVVFAQLKEWLGV
jgi:hypothetical protein